MAGNSIGGEWMRLVGFGPHISDIHACTYFQGIVILVQRIEHDPC